MSLRPQWLIDVGSGLGPIYSENAIHVDMKRCTHVEVICDAHHLPFKDKAFTVVYASHILEHLSYPLMALEEFKRVSNSITIIKVPNARHYSYERSSSHLYSWNTDTLKALLNRVFPRVEIYPSMRKSVDRNPFRRRLKNIAIWLLIALFKHNELTAICYSDKRR